MSSELFIDDFIQPILTFLSCVLICYTCVLAFWRWYRAEQQVQQVAEGYPYEEFYYDLCQYAGCTYTGDEARGIYAAWQERVVQREEEVTK